MHGVKRESRGLWHVTLGWNIDGTASVYVGGTFQLMSVITPCLHTECGFEVGLRSWKLRTFVRSYWTPYLSSRLVMVTDLAPIPN
jgi:hypothetical protein